MKKHSILSIMILLCFQGIILAQTESLFNGHDLSGWTNYGTELWYVEDGMLVCESGPDKEYGYLGTEKEYDDFELSLEFKQSADGNSGVFFRSSLEGTKITGWQVEVAPPESNTGGIYESYGRGWLIQPDPELDRHLKYGDWNTMKILVEGDLVETWLNGNKMITLRDEKIGAAKGIIALQIHSGGGYKNSMEKPEYQGDRIRTYRLFRLCFPNPSNDNWQVASHPYSLR